jgi:hypothetical protein
MLTSVTTFQNRKKQKNGIRNGVRLSKKACIIDQKGASQLALVHHTPKKRV